MIDNMNEITQFSPYGGKLVKEKVKGEINPQFIPENGVKTDAGNDRDMFVYIPVAACPDAKQAQVLMVLRDGTCEQSAYDTMKEYSLDTLAEEKHMVLVFPNAGVQGWNYQGEKEREDDGAYLVRCFAALQTSQGGVSGFNGMIFYIATSEAASAMIMTLSITSPTSVAGMMISEFPAEYQMSKELPQAPVVAYVCNNQQAEEYLKVANGVTEADRTQLGQVTVYTNAKNSCIRLLISDKKCSSGEIRYVWEELFSETRRWQNDTYGTYQKRTNFTERGFIPHVKDNRLGVNHGFAHTWYEYIPPQLRGSKEKVPLLLYFHGIGCVPLYGAEQSGWHDIADRENFIVVYPKPAIEKRWNVWNSPILPSDVDFVLALIEHMKQQYAIDETRIYISGFSMGSMMTNALACSYPDLFAAAAPCNAPSLGYLTTLTQFAPMLVKMNPASVIKDATLDPDETESCTKKVADQKKRDRDYRMPVIQNSGLLDGPWPIPTDKDPWIKTFDYWKNYNHIPVSPYTINQEYESGLTSDETFYEGEDQRFIHHKWFSEDQGAPSLYEVVLAKRMPHALDLRQLEIAWEFMKKFSRKADGSLQIENK